MASAFELSIKQGTDDSFTFTVKKNGSAINITGWTCFMTAKKNAGDPDSASVIGLKEGVVDAGTAGTGYFPFDASDTIGKEARTYTSDMLFKDASGKRQPTKTGCFTIEPWITQAEGES